MYVQYVKASVCCPLSSYLYVLCAGELGGWSWQLEWRVEDGGEEDTKNKNKIKTKTRDKKS